MFVFGPAHHEVSRLPCGAHFRFLETGQAVALQVRQKDERRAGRRFARLPAMDRGLIDSEPFRKLSLRFVQGRAQARNIDFLGHGQSYALRIGTRQENNYAEGIDTGLCEAHVQFQERAALPLALPLGTQL